MNSGEQHVFVTFYKVFLKFLVIYDPFFVSIVFLLFLYVTELKREFLRQVWVGYNLQTGFQ